MEIDFAIRHRQFWTEDAVWRNGLKMSYGEIDLGLKDENRSWTKSILD